MKPIQPQDVTTAVLAAGAAALILSGCGTGSDGGAPPVLLPTAVPADTSDCDPETIMFGSCIASAREDAQRAATKNRQSNADAQAAYADTQRPLMDRPDWRAYIGVACLIGSLLMFVKGGKSTPPRGRDPRGPAAALPAVKARRKRAYAAMALAIGIVCTSWWVAGVVGLVVLLLCGPVFAAAALRVSRLDGAEEGFKLAERRYQAAVRDARAESAAAATSGHDDLGLPLARKPAAVAAVPEPQLSIEAAIVYAKTGGVGVEAGSAAAALLDRWGESKPAKRAWAEACEKANLGSWDEVSAGERKPPKRRFVPGADLVAVTALPGGDATVTVVAGSIAVGEKRLNEVLAMFLRAVDVRSSVGGVERVGGTTYTATVTNQRGAAPPAPESTPDDEWV